GRRRERRLPLERRAQGRPPGRGRGRGGRALLYARARDGPHLGAAGVGRVVDVGPAPHDDRHPVGDLRELSHAARLCRRGRGAPARGAGERRGGGVTNLPYLFAAYAAVWIGLFVYLLRLERRSRELEEEVRELRRLLER